MSYLADLLDRFESKEELPQSGPFKSSKDTVAYQAHREAEKLSDLKLIDEIRILFTRKLTQRRKRNLVFILGELLKNQKSTEGVELYLSIDWKNENSYFWDSLVSAATRAKLLEYYPTVRLMIATDNKKNEHFIATIEYLEKVPGKEAIHLLGEILDHDCYGRCAPFFCCIALGNLGTSEALPYLERAAVRHSGKRKQLHIDAHAYARDAISKITGGERYIRLE